MSKKNKKLKLNLGCGNTKIKKFIGVDKYGNPDQKVDLEVFPWPWKDNSVKEIIMSHILEHLGKDTDTFLNIMKELYRISCNDTTIHIRVPHPKSESYLGDPTHWLMTVPTGTIRRDTQPSPRCAGQKIFCGRLLTRRTIWVILRDLFTGVK